MDFVTEYIFSKDYHMSTKQNMYSSIEKSKESDTLLTMLPHEEAFFLCNFWVTHILAPLNKALISHFDIPSPLPSCSLQLSTTHYPNDSYLDWHRDKGFIMGIMGPESGFMFQHPGSEKGIFVKLNEGEIFIYTGFQFKEYFSSFGQEIPQPTAHAVEAYSGRMSIVFNSFNLSSTPSGFEI